MQVDTLYIGWMDKIVWISFQHDPLIDFEGFGQPVGARPDRKFIERCRHRVFDLLPEMFGQNSHHPYRQRFEVWLGITDLQMVIIELLYRFDILEIILVGGDQSG